MKTIALVLAALLVLLQFKLWFSDVGLGKQSRLLANVAQQQTKEAELSERNDDLLRQIVALQSNFDAIESRARSDLGMVKHDEVFYFVPPTVQHPTHGFDLERE